VLLYDIIALLLKADWIRGAPSALWETGESPFLGTDLVLIDVFTWFSIFASALWETGESPFLGTDLVLIDVFTWVSIFGDDAIMTCIRLVLNSDWLTSELITLWTVWSGDTWWWHYKAHYDNWTWVPYAHVLVTPGGGIMKYIMTWVHYTQVFTFTDMVALWKNKWTGCIMVWLTWLHYEETGELVIWKLGE